MSSSFTFSGRESVLSIDIFPPIELNPEKDYVIGLIDFQTYNSIPNIDSTNNKFHYDNGKVITIPEGLYEIDDINRYLRMKLGVEYTDNEKYYYEHKQEHKKNVDFFNINPNVNTLKCNIISSHNIDFTHDDSVGRLLGFNKRVLEPFELHEAEKTVEIFKVNVIRIDCNIVTSSFMNGVPCHTIHEFFPDVSPGFKIIEAPTTVVYLPVNTRTINNITIQIVDQLGRLVNFRNEEISLRLHLKAL